MSEQEVHRRLGRLASEQLKLAHESRRQFILRIGANENTVSDFINGKRVPTSGTLRTISDGLGWDWQKVTHAIATTTDPDTVELTDLQPDPWAAEEAPAVSDVSDDTLLVELTRRLADRNATIQKLQAQLRKSSAPVPEPELPADVYGLAAHDPGQASDTQKHRAAQDEAGEEPQS